MRRLKVFMKACFIVSCAVFFLVSAVNQKYCKPITRVVLMYEETDKIDLFALNSIKAKEKVYNDLILYANALSSDNKSNVGKTRNTLSYLELVSNLDIGYCYLENEMIIKGILDEEADRILNDKIKANTQYFPVEELHGVNKSKGYLLSLSKTLYVTFAVMILLGWVIVLLKLIEILIYWRKR